MNHPNHLYRACALVLAPLLLMAIVIIAEMGQHDQRVINDQIRVAQQRQAALANLLDDLTDARGAQRGLLLTGAPEYLRTYQEAHERIEATLVQLTALFRQDDPALGLRQRQWAGSLDKLTNAQLDEINAALALYAREPSQAIALLRTAAGSTTMAQLRTDALQLRDAERSAVDAALARGRQLRIEFRLLTASAAALNILLLIITGVLFARESRHRSALTQRLELENQELERGVIERTEELSALSSHLQQIRETEKASLARELHDELGGLLIAVKMDVAWLQKRAPEADQAAQTRFNRILKVLDDGVDFKRRLVENLRPTLLDNMGLFPALRWITQETCSRAGLHYAEKYPEREPRLLDNAAIAVFRLAQESLANVVKHAHASEVRLAVALTDSELVLCVEDNGTGIAAERNYAVGSHGLATMRHRVRSFGGRLSFSALPMGGTRVLAQLPLAAILRPEGDAAPG